MITILRPEAIKKVVLIIHGMQEHRGRYLEFGQRLKDHNCLVLIPDLNGHGDLEPRGSLGGVLNQTQTLINLVKENQIEGIPNILFGHSMGSLFARKMLKLEPNLFYRVILSGSPAYNPLSKLIGTNLEKYSEKFNRNSKKNKLLNKAIIHQYNSKIKKPKTSYDWLSFNDDNVKNYLSDPDCGFDFTNDGLVDLFKLLEQVNEKSVYHSNTPVYLYSGFYDPCHLNQLDKIVDILKSNGHLVKLNQYYHSRHEILFDNDKNEVISDLLKVITFDTMTSI